MSSAKPKRRQTVGDKARRRDGDIGKLGTPGVFYTVNNWNTPQEEVIVRRRGEPRGS